MCNILEPQGVPAHVIFSIAEIATLLRAQSDARQHWQGLAERKLDDIELQMQKLQDMKRHLQAALGAWRTMAEVQVRPLRRAEYDLLVEQDAFGEDERIQLLDGELVVLSPQDAPHAGIVEALTERLVPALVGTARVRVQLPRAVGEYSEPEPDVAVVPADEPRDRHRSGRCSSSRSRTRRCRLTSSARRGSTPRRMCPSTG